MSKTKEEILGQPAYSHECGSFIEVDTRQEVLKAMDAWADQKLEEYKERLKKSITDYQILDSTFKNAVFAIIDSL